MENPQVLVLVCLALLMAMAGATQFKVGGSMGWTVPDPNAVSFNQWAEMNRFQIGDSLLFVYSPDKDSVLRVDKNAYDTCNTSTYIERFDDGNTVFTFNSSGPYYFVSGVEANCMRNESLVVVVMAERRSKVATPSLLPSPSSVPPMSPPPPPLPAVSGSPPSPSPPAFPEITPSTAPAAEGFSPPPPPPNGAPLKVAGFMGSVGAVLGSVFFVL